MVKQLKIIGDANINKNTPLTVNFATPVIIEPEHKITMDKFSAVIKDVAQNFDMPSSSYDLFYALNSPVNSYTTINMPAKHYDNIYVLLSDMTKLSNDAFTGYIDNGFFANLNYRDRGLKMNYSATSGNKFVSEYATCPFVDEPLSATNMATDTSGNFTPVPLDAWSITQTSPNNLLCKGGGAMCQFKIIIPRQVQSQADDISWNCGLFNTNQDFIGLTQNGNTGVLTLVSSSGIHSSPLVNDDTTFPNTDDTYIQMYVKNGYFQLRCVTIFPNGNEDVHFTTETNNSTDLGAFTINDNYVFGASGYNNSGSLPKINQTMTLTKDTPYGATQSQQARIMALNFENAPSLRVGLDVPAGLLLFAPQNSDFGLYGGTDPMNLSLINSIFDIAIECLDLPLETYQASTNRFPGSRKNVIAYFRPEVSSIGTSTYQFNVHNYVWLDIAITYPVNLSSLSFRIFNPVTNVDLIYDSCSFNLLINHKEY